MLTMVTLQDLSNIKWAMNQKVVFDGNDLTKVVGLLKGDALEVCLLLSRFYCSMYRKSMNEKLQIL